MSLRAFTLIELLTVIAIVAILAAIALGGLRGVNQRAKTGQAKAELAALAQALEDYKRHYGGYPQVVSDHRSTDALSSESLYAALNGQRGPSSTNGTFAKQQRVFIAAATLSFANPAAAGTAPNHFIDPWDRPYHYVYATAPAWKNPLYILASGGPDGEITLPFSDDGFFLTAGKAASDEDRPIDADNIYAAFP